MDKTEALALLRDHPEKMELPGALLMRKGPKDYVGAVPALSGTIYFKDAHTLEVRDAICDCFEEWEALAGPYLTWLWREEPAEGPSKQSYKKAKPMRDYMKRMNENDSVSYGYISGRNPEDAGPWQFEVYGLRAWEAKMGTRGLCSLRFTVPLLYANDHPLAMPTLFLSFVRKLKAVHGYAGSGLVLSLVRSEENEAIEMYLAGQANGLDVGHELWTNKNVVAGIKTVGWLTAINNNMVEKIGGLTAIRSELPMDWFALYDYGAGIVIQAGPKASAAKVDEDPKPAIYVLPNMLLREVRTPKIGSLHHASRDGELRLTGQAAEQWLQRFDVDEGELLNYKAKLLNEPKLTKATVLPDRL